MVAVHCLGKSGATSVWYSATQTGQFSFRALVIVLLDRVAWGTEAYSVGIGGQCSARDQTRGIVCASHAPLAPELSPSSFIPRFVFIFKITSCRTAFLMFKSTIPSFQSYFELGWVRGWHKISDQVCQVEKCQLWNIQAFCHFYYTNLLSYKTVDHLLFNVFSLQFLPFNFFLQLLRN